MWFESEQDLKREKQAINTFVEKFNGSFKKLDPEDIDYKVFDSTGKHIAYAEVKGRLRMIKDAFPLPVAARKLVKLADKRLNPVMIWSCLDGIVYCKVKHIKGNITWGGRKPRPESYNDLELMVYLDKKDSPFKTIYF
tara:strand:- start:452 stop:865 length:414 start_codon:yes stop_codon:yes gene_type:complete